MRHVTTRIFLQEFLFFDKTDFGRFGQISPGSRRRHVLVSRKSFTCSILQTFLEARETTRDHQPPLVDSSSSCLKTSQEREEVTWQTVMKRINRVTDVDLIRLAAEGQHRELRLQLRLLKNADVRDCTGRTALMEAARRGRTRCVQLLLDRRADANLTNCGGYTALHGAVKEGRDESVRLLLGARCDVNIPAHTGVTPLIQAVRYVRFTFFHTTTSAVRHAVLASRVVACSTDRVEAASRGLKFT